MSLAALTQPDIASMVEAAALLCPISYLDHVTAPLVLRLVQMHLDEVWLSAFKLSLIWNISILLKTVIPLGDYGIGNSSTQFQKVSQILDLLSIHCLFSCSRLMSDCGIWHFQRHRHSRHGYDVWWTCGLWRIPYFNYRFLNFTFLFISLLFLCRKNNERVGKKKEKKIDGFSENMRKTGCVAWLEVWFEGELQLLFYISYIFPLTFGRDSVLSVNRTFWQHVFYFTDLNCWGKYWWLTDPLIYVFLWLLCYS